MSETHLTTNIEQCEIEINGYNLIRCDSNSRHTGGTAIYIRNHIQFTVLTNINFQNNMWLLALKVIGGMKTGIYVVIYHSPNESHSIFLN